MNNQMSGGKVASAIFAVVILIIAQMAAQIIGVLLENLGVPPFAVNIIIAASYITGTLLGLNILCKKGLRLFPGECRITKVRLTPVWCVSAFAMPLAVIGIFLLMPGRWVHSSMSTADIAATITGAVSFYGLAGAVVEEAVFRGVIMTALERRWNRAVAILVPSMAFGLLHIIGNDLDFVSIIQLFIAGTMVGILFSLVTYKSGTIWCSALIHGVWNIMIIGGILNIGIKPDNASIFNYVLDTKSFALSGGGFGIEASVVSILVYLAFCILALKLPQKR